MTDQKTFTCLIPAFNEAKRLPGVLKATLAHPLLSRVVVIDDGSTDGTDAVAQASGAELLRTPQNLGKTHALLMGLRTVETSHVVLLDADLCGLTANAVSELIEPVDTGEAYVSVSLRGNAPWTWQRIGIDYISGERVFPMELIAGHIDELEHQRRFGFEVFFNELVVSTGKPVAVVRWPDVASPPKASKRGVWRGLLSDAAMLGDITRTIGVMGFASQIRHLRELSIT